MHFKNLKNTLFLLLAVSGTSVSAQQQDFNNFHNLRAEGNIPDDFTTKAYRKIDDDMENNRVDMKASRE